MDSCHAALVPVLLAAAMRDASPCSFSRRVGSDDRWQPNKEMT
jgi:hypothetical protein